MMKHRLREVICQGHPVRKGQSKDLSPRVSVWKLGLCPPCVHGQDNDGHLEIPSSATFSGRKSPVLWSSPSKCWREKNLPLKLTSRQSWVMGELEEQKLCSHTEEAKMPGLINEDLTSRDLKMPAFVQVFSLPENTELVPGIDAAQKGHSRLPLNEVFCSQHTTF